MAAGAAGAAGAGQRPLGADSFTALGGGGRAPPLARSFSSEAYDKMLANPRLSAAQRARILAMRQRRAHREAGGGTVVPLQQWLIKTESRQQYAAQRAELSVLRQLKEDKELRDEAAAAGGGGGGGGYGGQTPRSELTRLRQAAPGGMGAELARVQAEVAALKISLGLAPAAPAPAPAAAAAATFGPGAQCMARYAVDGEYYPAQVIEVIGGGAGYFIEYLEYGEFAEVGAAEVKEYAGGEYVQDFMASGEDDGEEDFDDPDELDYDEHGRRVVVAAAARSGAGGSKGVQHRGLSDDSYSRRHKSAAAIDPAQTAAFGGGTAGLVSISGNEATFHLVGAHSSRRVGRKTPAGGKVGTASRRGGQSALRFARLAEEKRMVWVGRVAELTVEHFKELPDCRAVVVSGSSELKARLLDSRVLRLVNKPIIVTTDTIDTDKQMRAACAKALQRAA